MKLPTLPGNLLNIEPQDPTDENTIYCPKSWALNMKKIMYIEPDPNYYRSGNVHRLTKEQVQQLDSKYKVIQFSKRRIYQYSKEIN
jgi:hypothetical protein